MIGERIEVSSRIQGLLCKITWDTGAQVSLVCETWLAENISSDKYIVRPVRELIDGELILESAGDGDIEYIGYTELSVRLGQDERAQEVNVPFLVTNTRYSIPILGSNAMDVLLEGENWKSKMERLVSFGLREADVFVLTGILNRWMEDAVLSTVTVQDDVVVSAKASKVVCCRIEATTVGKETPMLFQPNAEWESNNSPLVLYTAVLNLEEGINENINIKVRNKHNHDFHFRSGDLLGSLEEIQIVKDSVIAYSDFNEVESINKIRVNNVSTPVQIDAPDHGGRMLKSPVPIGDTQPDHWQKQMCDSEEDKPFTDLEDCHIHETSRPFYSQVSQMAFPELTANETAQAKQMLWEERGTFSQNPDDIGSVPELQLQLNTIDNVPVQRNYNAIPKPMYAEVRAQIQTMLDNGWIRRAESAWSSPIVLVKKKTGGMRLCCDFRLLNKKTIPDKHPIPRITEALDSLQGSCIFSVLDLSRAYYQGYMAKESCEKTAFVTPWGFYEWVRIPFGLSNAVPTFQRFMEKLLADYRDDFALPYLDDTIVHGDSVLEHIEQIRKVLRKFQEKGLKLNTSKCDLFKREVTYLGRIVSKDGYRMDTRSVQCVRELVNKKFETVGQIRQLMGLLSYHRRHVQQFASIAKPLTDLLAEPPEPEEAGAESTKPVKNGSSSRRRIEWASEHQMALEKLVGFITNPPILAYADFSSEFFLHTDASGAGLGAILYQEQQGVVRVIAYTSRSLKPSERNYHSTKLEFIAMKWSICESFRDYLSYADHFKVFTDNNPLLFVMGLSKPNSTIQRWISELGEYSFSVHYRPGVVNRDADCLSRLPLDIESYMLLCKEEATLDRFQMLVAAVEVQVRPATIQDNQIQPGNSSSTVNDTTVENIDTITDLRGDQEQDEYIQPVRAVLNGETSTKMNDLPALSKLLLRERARLFLDDDNLLWRKTSTSTQVVLPLKHREMIFKVLHTDMGHLGAERVLQLARQRVYWPKMKTDIEQFTQQRCRCNAQRRKRQEAVAPLVSIHSSLPMELVVIDYLHLEKSTGGYEYILLIVDHFSRWAQAYPTKNKSAATAAKHLFNDFVLKYSLPGKILHDQGKEFENRMFKTIERFCGVVRSRTTPYHPQANGTCERMNSTLLQMLRTLAESDKPKWHEHVNKLMAAYNVTTHSTTGYSPHFLLFGREPLIPLDLILGSRRPSGKQHANSYNKFVMEWEAHMKEAYKIARNNIQKVKSYSEERWRKRLIASSLQLGDVVLVKNKREQGGPGKIRAYWEQEIYVVTEAKANGVVYEVQRPQGGEKRVLHRNMLLPCDMLELEEEATPAQIARPPPAKAVTRSRSTRQQLHSSQVTDSDSSESEDDERMDIQPVRTHTFINEYQVDDDEVTALEQQLREPNQSEMPDDEMPDDEMHDEAIMDHDINTDETIATQEIEVSPQKAEADENQDVNTSMLETRLPHTCQTTDTVAEDITPRPESDMPHTCLPTDTVADETASIHREMNQQRSGRTLRSHGKTLAWNPSMGTRDVVLEEPASNARERPVDQVDRGMRRSNRRSQPPDKLVYDKPGSNPVVDHPVAEKPDVVTQASAVHVGQHLEGDEQGWWNWIKGTMEDLNIRLR